MGNEKTEAKHYSAKAMAILHFLDKPYTTEEIGQHFGMSPVSARREMSEMKQDGLILQWPFKEGRKYKWINSFNFPTEIKSVTPPTFFELIPDKEKSVKFTALGLTQATQQWASSLVHTQTHRKYMRSVAGAIAHMIILNHNSKSESPPPTSEVTFEIVKEARDWFAQIVKLLDQFLSWDALWAGEANKDYPAVPMPEPEFVKGLASKWEEYINTGDIDMYLNDLNG